LVVTSLVNLPLVVNNQVALVPFLVKPSVAEHILVTFDLDKQVVDHIMADHVVQFFLQQRLLQRLLQQLLRQLLHYGQHHHLGTTS